MAPGLVARMVVCSLVAIASTVHAERRPVVVIDLAATQPANQLAAELTAALNNHADLKQLDKPALTAALQGTFDDENAPHLGRARAKKQEAEEYLAQLDDENALKSAGAGMEELASVDPEISGMLALYAELAFAYGQAQLGLRKPNEASRAFQLAHRLDPTRSPDPTRYQPGIVQAYRAAADKPSIRTKLVVRGVGRVWIDGIEQGPAGNQYETTEGLHVVQLTGPERETRGDQVLLPSSMPLNIQDAPATEELKVKRARIELARARDAVERASAMKKLAALLGIGDAVLIAKDGNELTVQTWRNREPGFSALVLHRNEPPDQLLGPLAPPPLKVEKKFEPFQPPPPPIEEKRWYQKNWVRASIAGGIVVGVIGAILYANRDKMLPPLNPDQTWDTAR
jgi:hypothetical protein